MRQKPFDEREFRPSRSDPVADTPLFAAIRTEIPSAAGSDTSAEAAEAMQGKRQGEIDRVLIWFAAQSDPRTTHEMAAVLYPETGTGSACPRVNELVFAGCLERVGRQGKRSTLVITAKGRRESDAAVGRRGVKAA